VHGAAPGAINGDGHEEKGLAPVTTSATATSSRFGHASGLTCRKCGQAFPLGDRDVWTHGPLEIVYDLPPITRKMIESGPQSIWRYASLLPVPPDIAARPNLEPGWTRLIRCDRLARELGMRSLWVKDERGNPTHSFKDRIVATALTAAQQMGYRVLATPSTGNLANACAAAAARAGLPSAVIVPADLEPQKIIGSAVYGGTVIPVDGNYDDANRLAAQIARARADWAFVNVNMRSYYAEGSKTIGYEIAEQLGWRLPRQLVGPIASGSHFVKIDKGFRELARLGLVEDTPWRMFGAQASGCSPVSAAFRAGTDVIAAVRPDTIAKSLAIGNPADGLFAMDAVRRTGGTIARTEGIFGETAVGVTLGVLRRLLADGALDPHAETVIINSGDGLKTLDAVTPGLPELTAIPPTLEAFEQLEASTGLAAVAGH
jgi:threonine synthase